VERSFFDPTGVMLTMATITVWRRGERRCVLLVEKREFQLRVLDGDTVVREQLAKNADAALTLAAIWEQEQGAARNAGVPRDDRKLAS
jgi:hypothetical protein